MSSMIIDCIRAGLSCLKHGAAWPSGLGRCEVGRALDARTGAGAE